MACRIRPLRRDLRDHRRGPEAHRAPLFHHVTAAMEDFLHELWVARYVLLGGLKMTILISAASILAGSLLGLITGVSLAYGPRPLAWLMRGYVDVVRGTPVLVLVLTSFYVLAIVGIHFTAIQSGIFARSIFC